ncbi:MAG: rod shape-determining protein RodA [Fusobacteriaceae bacterium]
MERISEVKKIRRVSYTLLVNALCILCLSLISIYSTTAQRTLGFFYREIIFGIIGIGAYVVFSVIDYRYYSKYSKLIYILNILILLSVFIFGIKRLGAQRWIDLGFIVIQPSEFSKVMVILTFSDYLVDNYTKNRNDGFKKMFFSFFHIIPIFLLIAKQPDLGTSLSLVFIYLVVLFINGINWRVVVSLIGGVVAFVPLAYNFLLKPYQRQRVLTFLDPEADLLGSGWNVTQSKIAIGSGGIYGKGLLNSTQSKLRFLPEAHTDFIGSVYLEETGLVGGALLLLIYAILIFQIMHIGDKAKDEFGKLLCYGIGGVFLFHVIVNLGMVMGIMPVTGKPLLLMSYGGSSLILSFIMLGIVQSVKVHREL